MNKIQIVWTSPWPEIRIVMDGQSCNTTVRQYKNAYQNGKRTEIKWPDQVTHSISMQRDHQTRTVEIYVSNVDA